MKLRSHRAVDVGRVGRAERSSTAPVTHAESKNREVEITAKMRERSAKRFASLRERDDSTARSTRRSRPLKLHGLSVGRKLSTSVETTLGAIVAVGHERIGMEPSSAARELSSSGRAELRGCRSRRRRRAEARRDPDPFAADFRCAILAARLSGPRVKASAGGDSRSSRWCTRTENDRTWLPRRSSSAARAKAIETVFRPQRRARFRQRHWLARRVASSPKSPRRRCFRPSPRRARAVVP